MGRWYITGRNNMKKIIVFIIAISILPLISKGFNKNISDKSFSSTKEVKSSTSDEWTRVGTTVIYKKN